MHVGRHQEITHLLGDLEDKLAPLDVLDHDIAHRVEWLAEAVRELGISVSMVRKLLRHGRLSRLKVGARTFVTPVHLSVFREATEVACVALSLEK